MVLPADEAHPIFTRRQSAWDPPQKKYNEKLARDVVTSSLIRGHLRFCYPAAQKYPTAAVSGKIRDTGRMLTIWMPSWGQNNCNWSTI
jgi:hypothetical protein